MHAGEDVLSAVRSGALQLSPEIADHILDMLDQAGGIWLGDMEKDETLPPAAGEVSHKLAKVLRSSLPQSADAVARQEAQAANQTGRIDWLDAMRHQPDFAAFAAAAAASSSSNYSRSTLTDRAGMRHRPV